MSISGFPYATFLGAENRQEVQQKPVDMAAFVALKSSPSETAGVVPKQEVQGKPTALHNEYLFAAPKSLEDQLRMPTHATIPSKHRRGEVAAPRWQQWTHAGSSRVMSPPPNRLLQPPSFAVTGYQQQYPLLGPQTPAFSSIHQEQQEQTVGPQPFGSSSSVAAPSSPKVGARPQEWTLQTKSRRAARLSTRSQQLLGLSTGPQLFGEEDSFVDDRVQLVQSGSGGGRGGGNANSRATTSRTNSSDPAAAARTLTPLGASRVSSPGGARMASSSRQGTAPLTPSSPYARHDGNFSRLSVSPLTRNPSTARSQTIGSGRLATQEARALRWARKDERERLQLSHSKQVQGTLHLQQQLLQQQLQEPPDAVARQGVAEARLWEQSPQHQRQQQEASAAEQAAMGTWAPAVATVASVMLRSSSSSFPLSAKLTARRGSDDDGEASSFEQDRLGRQSLATCDKPSESISSELGLQNHHNADAHGFSFFAGLHDAAATVAGSVGSETGHVQRASSSSSSRSYSKLLGTSRPKGKGKGTHGGVSASSMSAALSSSSPASMAVKGGDSGEGEGGGLTRNGNFTLPRSPPPFYQGVPGDELRGGTPVERVFSQQRPMTHWTNHVDARPSLRLSHGAKPQTSTYLTLNRKSGQG